MAGAMDNLIGGPAGGPRLSANEVTTLYEKCLLFAEKKGFKVEHDGLLAELSRAGASVDTDAQLVRFGRRLVEDALRSVPPAFTLAAPDPAHDVRLPHPSGAFYGRTNTGATRYLDPDASESRPVRLADIDTWATVAGGLDRIGFCAFPSVSDAPQRLADVEAMRRLLLASAKHTWVQPYSEDSLDYLLELGAVAGGGFEGLRERPVVSFIACSLTPYTFKGMDAEVILKTCRHGIPIHACSLPSAGGTAPITPLGSAFVAAVEVLAMIVMTQLLAPGHPVVGTPLMFTMDMRSGRVNQSSPEALRASALAVQVVGQGFNVPTHTYGAGSDSPILDTQTSVEAAVQATVMALLGTDILGAAGQLETATCISPLQLIVDNEVMASLEALVGRTPLDDEALGWETLMAVDHGDTFLTTDHTYDHCREAWVSRLFTRDAPDVWLEKQRGDLMTRVRRRYSEILATPRPAPLSDDATAALDDVVDRARAALM